MRRTFLFIVVYAIAIKFGFGQSAAIYKDTNQPVDKRIENLLSLMTLEEKIALIHGNSKFSIPGVPRLGLPELHMTDGTHGVREECSKDSWNGAGWKNDSSTLMPVGICLAATWNPDLAFVYGKSMGEEARYRNKDILLGPGINIQRTPVCGRNFEYFGEDPYLASRLAVNWIKGVQTQNVSACVKHFFANNQEFERNSINVEMDDRTMHEIYLPAFKAAIVEGEAWSIMGSYNQFRGQHCCHNDLILNKILKQSWSFPGAVISDWDGAHNTMQSATNGLDIEMGTEVKTYDDYYMAKALYNKVKAGEVSVSLIDEKIRRILFIYFKTRLAPNISWGSFNTREHQLTSMKVAEEGIVLLKNQNNILPIDFKTIKSVAIIGENASREHHMEGGSSYIKAKYEITPLEALKKEFDAKGVKINYAKGYSNQKDANKQQLMDEAILAAKQSDIVLFFGGLSHSYTFDCEGYDRPDLQLPFGQNELIDAIAKANPKTVAVFIAGSAIEMPWIEKVPGIIFAWYPGMEGGNAIYNIISGITNPSGKLPFTFPVKLMDSPAHAMGNYPGKNGVVKYEEGILVGYRYFDTKKVQPLFPFGFGLSYTNFQFSDIKASGKSLFKGQKIDVSVKIKNIGKLEGSEVVQLYVQDEKCSVIRPANELKAFQKISLKPGELKEIIFSVEEQDLSFFDVTSQSWIVEPGKFKISIGNSSRNLAVQTSIEYK